MFCLKDLEPLRHHKSVALTTRNYILTLCISWYHDFFPGKYLLLRDPNKPVMRLYDIPDNSFESDDSESDSGEEDGEDSEDEETGNDSQKE